MPWKAIIPNADGDWVSQRSDEFLSYPSIGSKKEKEERAVFSNYSLGLVTNRDPWAYSFSKDHLTKNVKRLIEKFNYEMGKYKRLVAGKNPSALVADVVDKDPKEISWTRGLLSEAAKLRSIRYDNNRAVVSAYRPFTKQNLYFDSPVVEQLRKVPELFPTPEHANIAIAVIGVVDRKGFSVLATNEPPNLHFLDTGQCFPLYYYEKFEDKKTENMFGHQKPDKHGYIRRDAITDFALNEFKTKCADAKITKEDIFYYVYGLLHSPTYRAKYQNDLKKMLPRIPLCKDFWGYSKTGRALAETHVGYDACMPYPLKEQIAEGAPKKPKDLYRVNEAGMKFPKEKKVEESLSQNPHANLRIMR